MSVLLCLLTCTTKFLWSASLQSHAEGGGKVQSWARGENEIPGAHRGQEETSVLEPVVSDLWRFLDSLGGT